MTFHLGPYYTIKELCQKTFIKAFIAFFSLLSIHIL